MTFSGLSPCTRGGSGRPRKKWQTREKNRTVSPFKILTSPEGRGRSATPPLPSSPPSSPLEGGATTQPLEGGATTQLCNCISPRPATVSESFQSRTLPPTVRPLSEKTLDHYDTLFSLHQFSICSSSHRASDTDFSALPHSSVKYARCALEQLAGASFNAWFANSNSRRLLPTIVR
jgi:hypothetical protein